MNNYQILEDGQNLLKNLTLINNCFNYRHGLDELAEEFKNLYIQPQIQNFTAYRYILLSDSLEDQGAAAQKKAQLDWDKLRLPFQSWAKHLDGARAYAKNYQRDSHYQVLVKAEIKGFCLYDYAQDAIEVAKKYLRTNSSLLNLKDYSLYSHLSELCESLHDESQNYAKEQEVVPVEEIATFEILEGELNQ